MKAIKYLKLIIFIAIIVGIPLTIFLRYPDFGHILTDREALSNFLAANEGQNAIVYLLIVVVTVTIGLPIGQVINFAGGYIFGAPFAYLLSICGTIGGCLIAFYVARHFGKEFVNLIFKEKNVEKFVQMMSTSKAYVVIILIYLIPGFPKDMFTYAAGLTKLRIIPFALTAAVARTPGMLGTLLLADFLREGNYIGVAIVVTVIAAFLVFVLFRRKQIFSYIENLHGKIIR